MSTYYTSYEKMLFVAMDIGKNVHWLAEPRYELIVLGHEPTGVYHENWARALLNRYARHMITAAQPRLDYRFLNPLLVKRQRETLTSGRRRKTDALDLAQV
jgi:transposase